MYSEQLRKHREWQEIDGERPVGFKMKGATVRPDIVDINFGCPVKVVLKALVLVCKMWI
jgi:hypothetical protein